MSKFQVSIEGNAPEAATEELVAGLRETEAIQGSWETQDPSDDRDFDTLATLADFITLTGCSIPLVAGKIWQWYNRRKKKEAGPSLDKVVLICGKDRVLMRDATLADIERFLEKC